MKREASLQNDAIADWQQRQSWFSLAFVSALLAIAYPLAAAVWPPPGSEPLTVRLAVAALAAVILLAACFVPAIRTQARWLLLFELVLLFALQGVYAGLAGLPAPKIDRIALLLIVMPLALLYVGDLLLIEATLVVAVFAAALSAHVALGSTGPQLSTLFVAVIVVSAVGWMAIGSRTREMRARFSAETAQAAQIALLRTRDPVTGLPNFNRFMDLCTDATNASYVRGRRFAVVQLDLDRFSRIVEANGHAFADAALAEAGRRFEDVAKGAVVCRGRADSFLALVVPADAEQATRIAHAFLDSLAPSFVLGSKTAYITATTGVAVWPQDGEDAESLLNHAAAEIRRARTGTVDPSIARTRDLRDGLTHAVARGELRLQYQPYVNSRTRAVIGAEALLRWQHPLYGFLPPSEFITFAERDEQIAVIGEWVLRQSVAACAAWQEFGNISVSVNVSLPQFRDPSLCERVGSALRDSGLSADRLIVELTESAAMQNPAYTTRTIGTCAAWGVRFALDDFGTGHSSLAHLKHLPIDALKLDRAFIAGLPSEGDAAIVRAILMLARSLRCVTFAEGVETAEQAEWLAHEGCDVLQGFALARPMEADEVTAMLRSSGARSLQG